MTAESGTHTYVVRNAYEQDAASYWDSKRDAAINMPPGETDGLYHHHYGLGDFDHDVLTARPDVREAQILAEVHRLENEQVKAILTALGPLSPQDRVLDAGSGRGGTSFLINERFGCQVDGVSFARYQVDFSQHLAAERGCVDQVRFHYQNMVATEFPDQHFQRVVTNETTMYVDPFEAFQEFARVLAVGGCYVLATWCCNDALVPSCREIEEIDKHYVCHIHRRSTYFQALAANGLVPSLVMDLTAEAVPYWELRSESSFRTGIERAFLDSHRARHLNYLIVVADRRCDG